MEPWPDLVVEIHGQIVRQQLASVAQRLVELLDWAMIGSFLRNYNEQTGVHTTETKTENRDS